MIHLHTPPLELCAYVQIMMLDSNRQIIFVVVCLLFAIVYIKRLIRRWTLATVDWNMDSLVLTYPLILISLAILKVLSQIVDHGYYILL